MRPLILLVLGGCVSTDEMLAALDRDGDGAYDAAAADLGETGPFDCDDDDAQIGPGVAEACNGVDDDCDGDADEAGASGETVSYADGDADGYGDEDKAVSACVAPAGNVTVTGDCDDGDSDVHPGLADPCNGEDDDCDGTTDEDTPTWYDDADEDGYGDPNSPFASCDAPGGHVGNADDCDDDDPTVNPDGTEECDGVDNDCDELLDRDDPDNTGDATWYPDADGDTYGDGDNPLTVCDRPAGYVRNTLDCDDSSAAIKPGAAEVCEDGIDQDCDSLGRDVGCGIYGAADLADATGSFASAGSDYFALGLATGRDLDGDGFDDLAFGEPDASALAGRTWIVYGGMAPFSGDHDVADVSAAWYDGAGLYDLSGASVAFPGDMDGDGHEDVAIAAVEMDGARPGSVYLAYGSGARESGALSLSSAPRLAGDAVRDLTGRPMAPAGDFDADGLGDLLVAAPDSATEGRVYVLPGRSSRYTSSDSLLTAAHVWEPEEHYHNLGFAVSGGYDVDGDGVDDAVVGAPYGDGTVTDGRAYVVLGDTTSGTVVISDVAALVLEPAEVGNSVAWVGTAVSVGPDYDGDGLGDVAVGATMKEGGRGAAWVVEGASTWAGDVEDVDAIAFAALIGSAVSDEVGANVLLVGDTDGDDKSEWVVGAPGAASGDGVVYVVEGGTSGTVSPSGTHAGAGAVAAGSVFAPGGGDVNGDGFADLLVGGNTFGEVPGEAWLLYGGP
jgi:hypothetical protein